MGPWKVIWLCMTLSSQLSRQFLLAHFQGVSHVEKEKAKSNAKMSNWSMAVLANQMRFKHNGLHSSLPFSAVNQNQLPWNHAVYAAKNHSVRVGNHIYSFPKLMVLCLLSPSMAMSWFDKHPLNLCHPLFMFFMWWDFFCCFSVLCFSLIWWQGKVWNWVTKNPEAVFINMGKRFRIVLFLGRLERKKNIPW